MNINELLCEKKIKTAKSNMSLNEICGYVRNHINDKYRDEMAGDITTEESKDRYMILIQQILYEKNLFLEEYTEVELIELIYNFMAKYDFLTPYLEGACGNLPDNPLFYTWEEINGNRWDDIEIKHPGGYIKLKQAFSDPRSCTDLVKKLAMIGGLNLDISNPIGNSFIGNGIRIEAAVPPCVDSDVGAVFSIRRQKSCTNNKEFFLGNGTAIEEELDLITLFLDNNISVGVAGDTGSGKTALMNYQLNNVAPENRIITIEDTRELNCVRKDESGNYISRAIHLLTKDAENPSLAVTASDLLKSTLRLNPNIIGLGEMRGNEAKQTVAAGCTGHTILSGLHAGGPRSAYRRISTLYMDAGTNLSERIVLENIIEAFPIMVFKKAFKSGERKIMSITEAYLSKDPHNPEIIFNPLYQFKVDSFEKENDKLTKVKGQHVQVGRLSDTLAQKLFESGVAIDVIKKYARDEYVPGKEAEI